MTLFFFFLLRSIHLSKNTLKAMHTSHESIVTSDATKFQQLKIFPKIIWRAEVIDQISSFLMTCFHGVNVYFVYTVYRLQQL